MTIMIPVGVINPLFFLFYFISGIVSLSCLFLVFFPRYHVWGQEHPIATIFIGLFVIVNLLFFSLTTHSFWKLHVKWSPVTLQDTIENDGFVIPKGTQVSFAAGKREGDQWDIKNYIELKFPHPVTYKDTLKVVHVERNIWYTPLSDSEKTYRYTSSLILKLAEDSVVESFLCSKENPVVYTTVSYFEIETQDLLFSSCSLATDSYARNMDGVEVKFPANSRYTRYYTPQLDDQLDQKEVRYEIGHRIEDVYVQAAPIRVSF